MNSITDREFDEFFEASDLPDDSIIESFVNRQRRAFSAISPVCERAESDEYLQLKDRIRSDMHMAVKNGAQALDLEEYIEHLGTGNEESLRNMLERMPEIVTDVIDDDNGKAVINLKQPGEELENEFPDDMPMDDGEFPGEDGEFPNDEFGEPGEGFPDEGGMPPGPPAPAAGPYDEYAGPPAPTSDEVVSGLAKAGLPKKFR